MLAGNEYSVIGKKFILGNRCPECAKKNIGLKIRKSSVEFDKTFKNIYGNKIIMLEPYEIAEKPLHLKCNKCGRDFYRLASVALPNFRDCPYCTNHKKTDKMFRNEVFELVGNEYTFFGEYKNAKTKMKVKHNICGHEYNVKPGVFLNGRRCPYCNGGVKYTQDEAAKNLFNKTSGEYSIIGEYVNNQTPVLIRHNRCKNEFMETTRAILSNDCVCPFCNESTGEREIRKYLDKNNHQYIFQFIDKNLNYLRFDFAVITENNYKLIEFDGIFHFIPFPAANESNRIENYRSAIMRDIRKDKYCQNNNIDLLRINFWNYSNIDDILNDYLLHNTPINEINKKYKNKIEYLTNDEVFNIFKNANHGNQQLNSKEEVQRLINTYIQLRMEIESININEDIV